MRLSIQTDTDDVMTWMQSFRCLVRRKRRRPTPASLTQGTRRGPTNLALGSMKSVRGETHAGMRAIISGE